jgi:hypothetical protein
MRTRFTFRAAPLTIKVGGKVFGAVEDELSRTADFVHLPDRRHLCRDHGGGALQQLVPRIDHRLAEIIVPLHVARLGHDRMFQNP